MGSSMLDQLKKAGLVDDKRVKKVKAEKYKVHKQTGRNQDAEQAKKLAKQAKSEQAERDRKLNEQRRQEADRKAVAAQVKQLVEENRVTERDGEQVYNFTAGAKIKRLYLSEEVHKRVSDGRLSIVNLNGRYELVPAAVADKIMARDEKAVVVDNRSAGQKESKDEDDPYAGYEVPDDLMW